MVSNTHEARQLADRPYAVAGSATYYTPSQFGRIFTNTLINSLKGLTFKE